MNITTKISLALIILGLSTNIFADERLNGRQAAEACKQKITETYADDSEIKFNRNPASSMSAGAYKFWINTTESIAGDTNSIKYQCEITRAGELVQLTREPGRWNI